MDIMNVECFEILETLKDNKLVAWCKPLDRVVSINVKPCINQKEALDMLNHVKLVNANACAFIGDNWLYLVKKSKTWALQSLTSIWIVTEKEEEEEKDEQSLTSIWIVTEEEEEEEKEMTDEAIAERIAKLGIGSRNERSKKSNRGGYQKALPTPKYTTRKKSKDLHFDL